MHDEFDAYSLGRFFVEGFTAGLHGFPRSKMFKITSADGRFAAAHTFQFSDRVVAGLAPAAPTSARPRHIAISQLLTAACYLQHPSAAVNAKDPS